MGYIFDALNRAARHEPPARHPGDAAAPTQPASDSDPSLFGPQPAVSGELHTANQTPEQTPGQPLVFPTAVREPDETHQKVDDRLVMLTEPASLLAEEYRAIRTGILARWEHKRHLAHTITSATPQEGKTITSLNLALCFAELHNRATIVIECDLRLPQFGKLLNMPPQPGMVDHLTDNVPLEQLLYRPPGSNLHLIPAGLRAGDQTVQLLSSQRMAELITRLKRHYDHIIVDTPPVVELADAGILGAMCDDVLLVARMGRTPRTLVEQAIRTLHSYHAPVAGLIATDQARPRRRHYYHRYGYHYPYASYTRAA